MAEINTVINIMTQDGELIALNTKIKEVKPVASQPSIIDEISVPSGNGFYTGDVHKQVKRSQVDSTAATTVNGAGGFVGATSQNTHKVFIGKKYREDNILYNEIDLTKLREGKGGDIIALETGNFLITGRELDAKELLAELKVQAAAAFLHTSFDTNTKPTGVQPVQAATTFAGAVTAIQGGRRVVTLADFDENEDTRASILREAIAYLNTIGSERNTAETLYLFSINGLQLAMLKILTDYRGSIAIKDSITTNFISVTSKDTVRNINGLVGYLDSIKVLVTNQIPASTNYLVVSDRVITRDLDQTTQYIGKVRDTAVAKMKDDSVVSLKPNERLMQYLQGRSQGITFFEEAIFIDKV